MIAARRLAVTLVGLAAVAAGCQTGLFGGTSEWSRTYLQNEEQVWLALLDTLAEEGLHLDDVDRDAGRVRAAGGHRDAHREAVLEIRLQPVSEGIRVDVEGRMGLDPGAEYHRLDRLVETLLTSLDERILGRPGTSADRR